mmetsp:Transcript_83652/g.132221  ORF Transcript_83652/g.132221 Transcript_83652/m.132221 type:complete len:630 (+) Transcript_83652:61-1950(+)|eukprot:CAMPEP_0169105508 /NCGR_PEP_ID=MMETSP1015-20121227/23833_1 /TAXON_ID=342587 /ORGANISM="Karlodinium micrum, Strain CCMP2283" /LENGTH=629 /DNA_ID=CAMNT_0009166871 /DNA_START=52 /DNA_END=1941 /DNA_ORIENTATION=+
MARRFRNGTGVRVSGCLGICVLAVIRCTDAIIEDEDSIGSVARGGASIVASLDHEGAIRVQNQNHQGPLAASLLRHDGTRSRKSELRHQTLTTEDGMLDLRSASAQRDFASQLKEGAKLSDGSSLTILSTLLQRSGVDVPIAVLAAGMFSSFLAGICFVICCINLHTRKRSQLSDPLLEDQEEDGPKSESGFQTIDSQDAKTRYWRWCAESRVQELGVLTQAPTRPFENFSRIDVEVEEKAVMTVLNRADVDFTQFNVKRHMEPLLLKLVGGECFFMAVQDASKVVLMVESVRIRCIHEEFVLIREPDQSLLAKSLALPGIEKPTSEPPAVAAKKLWSKILKMADDSAEFIEDGIEDKEMKGGYNGIRCVERCHIMAVRLRGDSTDPFSQIGLPRHSAFASSAEEGEPDKLFLWKKLDDCGDIGVRFAGNDHMGSLNIRGSVMANASDSEHFEKIKDFLRAGGVDSDKWGEADSGKMRRLCEEVRSGICVLEKTDRGVQRCVNILMLRLWSPDERLLVQSKSPTDAAELQLPEIKKDIFESLTSAAVRLLQSRLLLTESNVRFEDEYNWEYYDEIEPSKLYPGLWTKQQKFFVNAVLLDDDDNVLKRVGLPVKEVEVQESDSGDSGEGF